MKNKLLKFELAFTAIIVIIACCGIGLAIHNRIDKGSGELTTENYVKYMQVECRLGNGTGSGYTMTYDYYVTVKASPHYKLENVTIAYSITYSLEGDGADLPDGTLTFSVEAGKSFYNEFKNSLTVTQSDKYSYIPPTLKITVKSVKGTYVYNA